MPVGPVLLTTSANGTDLTSYTTAVIAPSANRLVLACIWSNSASPVPTTVDSLTGASMTWDSIATLELNEGGADLERLTVFRSLNAAPGTGALTIDYGADTQKICGWAIVEFRGVDTSGTNGTGAVEQVRISSSLPSITTPSLAFLTPTRGENGTFGVLANSSGTKPISPGGAFTEISEFQTSTGGSLGLQTEGAPTGVNTVNWTISAGGDASIYAIVELGVGAASGDDPAIGILGRGAGW